MLNKVKKKPSTVYLPDDLTTNVHQRAIINNRTFSGEVENMLTKLLTLELENDRKAIMGASGTKTQS